VKRSGRRDTFICPHCGADVPVNAYFCRECGSDAETGWSEDADVWEAGIPAGYGSDDDFDYDESVEKDLPEHAMTSPDRESRKCLQRVLIAFLCLSLLYWLSRS
jgi:hypothetical protein